MSNLRTLLRDADPLRHEAPPAEPAFERVRLAALRAPVVGRTATSTPARRIAFAALAIAAVVVSLALGYQLWEHASTPLLAAVRFEVRLAEEQPAPGLIVARVPGSDRLIYLHPEVVVDNDDIAQSWVSEDDPDRYGVGVRFLSSGAERMRQATTAHLGRPVAILLDGAVVTAPVVRSAISDVAVISGPYTRAEAESIARAIEVR